MNYTLSPIQDDNEKNISINYSIIYQLNILTEPLCDNIYIRNCRQLGN